MISDPISAAFENEVLSPVPRHAVWNLKADQKYWLWVAWGLLFALTVIAFAYIHSAFVALQAVQPSMKVDRALFWILCIGSLGLVASIPLILYAVAFPFLKLARFGTAVEVTVLALEVETSTIKSLRITYQRKGAADAPVKRSRVPFTAAALLCPRIRDLSIGDTLIAVSPSNRPDHPTLWLSIRMWVDMPAVDSGNLAMK